MCGTCEFSTLLGKHLKSSVGHTTFLSYFGATSSSSQNILLALCSGIPHDSYWGDHIIWGLGTEAGFVTGSRQDPCYRSLSLF